MNLFTSFSFSFFSFRLKLELEDRRRLESNIEALDEKLKLTCGVLSKTQALLLTERNNSQQLALHIDLLKVSSNNLYFYLSLFYFSRNNMKWIEKNLIFCYP